MATGSDIIGIRPDSKKDWALKHAIQILLRQREELDTKIKELRCLLPKREPKKSKPVKIEKNGITYKLR
jgi:hypothetical protein